MTGGQMAPTTLIGQYASTAPYGRDYINSGYPVKMAELMATMPGVCYSERVAVNTPANIAKAKNALKKAFKLQLEGKGLGFVEVLSMCPTGWKMPAVKATEWITDVLSSEDQFPLGVKKDVEDPNPGVPVEL
jgi:2-oxoglutarate ferredoxin oxidoreductase subunit beta